MTKTLSFAKFTAVAIALGFISPTITTHNNATSSTISEMEFSILSTSQAREVKKKNRSKNKNTNTNTNINRNKNKNTNVNVNSNKNTNVNVNRNKNTNVNVNVNNNKRRGPRPLGVLAGMAIGTVIVASAMSPSCTTVLVNGISYRQCDGTYYQQSGPDYIVVKSPY